MTIIDFSCLRQAVAEALKAAQQRADCDVSPVVVALSGETLPRSKRRVVEVDVCYSSKGYCALYGAMLNYHDNDLAAPIELYQD